MNVRPSQSWVTGSEIRIVKEDTSRALNVGRHDTMIVDAKNDLPVISADAEVTPLSSVSKDAQRVERYTSVENPRWKGLQNAPQVVRAVQKCRNASS